MYIYIVYGFVSLVGTILIARVLHALVLRRLDSEERSQLLRVTVRLRRYALLPAVVMVVAFLVALYLLPNNSAQVIQWFLVAITLYLLLLNGIYFAKMGRARMRLLFVFSALLSRLISFTGIVLFLYFLYRALTL